MAHDLGGRGPVLLLAHATGLCARAYDPLAAVLRAHHRVWALDFRGHGDSTAPEDGDFGWSGMADDVLAVADALGVSGIAGVGHSMGGAALLLAELARPGLLASAYLYEPIIIPASDGWRGGASPMPDAARRRRATFASKAEALMRYARRPPLNTLRADCLAAYVEHGLAERPDGTVELKCSPEHEARTFESDSKATVDRIAGLSVPTVVAVGARYEGFSPAQFAPSILEAMPRATVHEFGHLGHFGPLQDPDTIAQDALALFRGAL